MNDDPSITEDYLQRLVARLKDRGVTVELLREDDVERVTIAQLKDFRIIINPHARDPLGALFTVAHLFGHLVQFTNYEAYRHLTEGVEGRKPLKLSEDFRLAFYAYEREAFGYGKSLMEEAFVSTTVIERQYAIFMETDFEHFWNFLTTGLQGDVVAFNTLLKRNYAEWTGPVPEIPTVPLPETLVLRRPVSVNVS